MHRRTLLGASLVLALPPIALAHHGWSRFDQSRPLWLSGSARRVHWRNPHVELQLEIQQGMRLPEDLPQRRLPGQMASVDGAALLRQARLPRRLDRYWEVELAPLTRMQAWKVPEIVVGTPLEVLGFTFTGEQGEAVLRAECLFMSGGVYGLRSSPA